MAKTKHFGLVLLSTLLLLAASVIYAGNAQAQGQATVTVLPAIGGTTTPGAGTTQVNGGSTVTVSANPSGQGQTFSNWIISQDGNIRTSTDTTLSFTAAAGSTYTIEPVFQNLNAAPGVSNIPRNLTDAAIVILLPAAGGTTIPGAGAYAFTNATAFNITAMPDNGWTFSHWVISGNVNTTHGGYPFTTEPKDNPYNVNHGYGYTYYYQPVFTQSGSPAPSASASGSPLPTHAGSSGSPMPSPSIPEFSILAVLGILVALAIPAAIITRKRRTH
jgi:hypothetical protein